MFLYVIVFNKENYVEMVLISGKTLHCYFDLSGYFLCIRDTTVKNKKRTREEARREGSRERGGTAEWEGQREEEEQ